MNVYIHIYVYIYIYIYILYVVCPIQVFYMLAHTCAHVLCVCRHVQTSILGTVCACKHVLRVREGSRNGCGICQDCLRQASSIGGKKSLGSGEFFYFYGGWGDKRQRDALGEGKREYHY